MITQQVTWNLTGLFSSLTDPKIDQAIKEAETTANAFEKTYRSKVAHLTAEDLLNCFRDVEAFEAKFSDLTLYSSLSFSADMTQSQAQTLNDKIDKLSAKIGKQLAFYSLR